MLIDITEINLILRECMVTGTGQDINQVRLTTVLGDIGTSYVAAIQISADSAPDGEGP